MAFDFPPGTEGLEFTPIAGLTYVYKTNRWVVKSGTNPLSVAVVSDTPPANPANGQLWWESDSGNLFLWYNDGSSQQWVQVSAFSDTASVLEAPNDGKLYGRQSRAWSEIVIREKLTANRVYYVRTDGSDSNDGLSNTAGGAFATIVKAFNTIRDTLDCGPYLASIKLNSGMTYTEQATLQGPHLGMQNILIQGSAISEADAANYKWGSAGRTLYATRQARISLSGVEISSTGDSAVLSEDNGTQLQLGAYLRYGAAVSSHIWAYGGGRVLGRSPYTILGNAAAHCRIDNSGLIDIVAATVTFSGTPAITNFCHGAGGGGTIGWRGTSVVGSCTGSKFLTVGGCGISTNNSGINYLPGSTAGTTTAPGWYW